MKLTVALAKYNGTGSIARVENGNDDSIEIAGSDDAKPRATCLAAAKALRDAAARFELLAQESEPYQSKVHDRINRAKVTPNDRNEPTGKAQL